MRTNKRFGGLTLAARQKISRRVCLSCAACTWGKDLLVFSLSLDLSQSVSQLKEIHAHICMVVGSVVAHPT